MLRIKHLLRSLLAIAMVAGSIAPQARAERLKFRDDGTFKIVQFTDTHYKWGKKASNKAVECIALVLDAEQPDLVIFTGDQVYSNGVANSLEVLFVPVIERGLPFGIVFGNHDHQFDLSLDEIYDIVQGMPGSEMPERAAPGVYDYTITIGSGDSGKTARVLYCMDTHDKTMANRTGVGGYDWLTNAQIGWYLDTSAQLAYGSEDGNPVPALLFIHIPLPEYKYAWDEAPDAIVGRLQEKNNAICCSTLNSGMFAAIKEQGDVKGVFCGHDHDNDYVTVYRDVLLGYGRYTGGNTVYNHLKGNGARVILLDESHPERITTWIRLSDGSQLDLVTFPDDFKKK